MQELTQSTIPTHIAIIMDGNGRWAQQRGLPRSAGHKAGMETVQRIVRACADLGLEALTLYGTNSTGTTCGFKCLAVARAYPFHCCRQWIRERAARRTTRG